VTGRVTGGATLRTPDGALAIRLAREEWPHGRTGPAFAHAALFRP
jgi:hypothetical protein